MKKNELTKKPAANGCYMKLEKTNHEWWYSPKTKQYFAIPRHGSKEVADGTLNNISKQSGVKL